ncbi:MAG: c-type cytochrome [Planctomycetota bacterium]|jgi:nitric oxide reductase subunit C
MDSHDTQPRSAARFWPARCDPFTKQLLLLGLLTAFFVQTHLVYTDIHDTERIGDRELAGRRLWHQSNCQTCHQLHGFGGFLGPDLTNAAARLERGQLDALLTIGEGQMPAFEMEPDQIDTIWAFLNAMNETGTGQARNSNLARLAALGAEGDEPPTVATTPDEALLQVIVESGHEDVAAGFTLFRSRACLSCHALFARSAVGAPDLSRSGSTLTTDEIKTVLREGRLPKMPPPVLSRAERAQVHAFIEFMAEHRQETLERVVEAPSSFWTSLPWWEYE